MVVAICAAVFALLTVDVLADARGFLDLRLMRAIQRLDLPGLEPIFRVVDTLTGHDGAIAMWTALLAAFVFLR